MWLALCSHTHSSCCGYQKAVEAVPWSWPGCLNAINTILLRWYVVCAEKEKRTKKLACASWRVLVLNLLTRRWCVLDTVQVLVLLTLIEFCGHCLASELSNLPVVMSNCVTCHSASVVLWCRKPFSPTL